MLPARRNRRLTGMSELALLCCLSIILAAVILNGYLNTVFTRV